MNEKYSQAIWALQGFYYRHVLMRPDCSLDTSQIFSCFFTENILQIFGQSLINTIEKVSMKKLLQEI